MILSVKLRNWFGSKYLGPRVITVSSGTWVIEDILSLHRQHY